MIPKRCGSGRLNLQFAIYNLQFAIPFIPRAPSPLLRLFRRSPPLLNLLERFIGDVEGVAVEGVGVIEAAGPAGIAVGPVPPLVVAVAEAGGGHRLPEDVAVGAGGGREIAAEGGVGAGARAGGGG